MKDENAIRDKSYVFTRRCVKLYKYRLNIDLMTGKEAIELVKK